MTSTETLTAESRRHDRVRRTDTGPGSRGRIAQGLRRSALPLAAVAALGFVASIVGELGISGLGRAVLGVPSDFKALTAPDIFPYAFAPIVGCSLAFIAVFIVKKPGAHSAHLFLTVGLKFAVLDLLLALLAAGGSMSAGTIVTLVAVVLYPLLIIPALLRFVPRPGFDRIQPLAAAAV
jgi:hypothetical protein